MRFKDEQGCAKNLARYPSSCGSLPSGICLSAHPRPYMTHPWLEAFLRSNYPSRLLGPIRRPSPFGLKVMFLSPLLVDRLGAQKLFLRLLELPTGVTGCPFKGSVELGCCSPLCKSLTFCGFSGKPLDFPKSSSRKIEPNDPWQAPPPFHSGPRCITASKDPV